MAGQHPALEPLPRKGLPPGLWLRYSLLLVASSQGKPTVEPGPSSPWACPLWLFFPRPQEVLPPASTVARGLRAQHLRCRASETLTGGHFKAASCRGRSGVFVESQVDMEGPGDISWTCFLISQAHAYEQDHRPL